MALYHFSGQIISRSKGQSAVASAAYHAYKISFARSVHRIIFHRCDKLH